MAFPRRGSKHLPPDAIRYFLAAIPAALEEKFFTNGGFVFFKMGFGSTKTGYVCIMQMEALVEHFPLETWNTAFRYFAFGFLGL